MCVRMFLFFKSLAEVSVVCMLKIWHVHMVFQFFTHGIALFQYYGIICLPWLLVPLQPCTLSSFLQQQRLLKLLRQL